MKFIICLLSALLLSAARPLAPHALPPAIVHAAPRSPIVVPRQPAPTPAAVIINGQVHGHTSYGSPAPLGLYAARGATIGEATINAEILEAQVAAEYAAQHVAVAP